MTGPNLETFLADARRWLDLRLPLRKESAGQIEVGDPFSTAVFHSSPSRRRRPARRASGVEPAARHEGLPRRHLAGRGRGLGLDRVRPLLARLEAEYETPGATSCSTSPPSSSPQPSASSATPATGPVRRAAAADEIYCCQFFSEPWLVDSPRSAVGLVATAMTGSSTVRRCEPGAQFAEWGELIARTDPDVPKHRGLTAFLVPMDLPGIVVRPIRQMTGGSRSTRSSSPTSALPTGCARTGGP